MGEDDDDDDDDYCWSPENKTVCFKFHCNGPEY